jgi:hypothetical protein
VWIGPELFVKPEDLSYDHRSDVYSYGIMLWEWHTRQDPWSEVAWICDIEEKVLKGERPKIFDWCLKEYRELIEGCWVCLSLFFLGTCVMCIFCSWLFLCLEWYGMYFSRGLFCGCAWHVYFFFKYSFFFGVGVFAARFCGRASALIFSAELILPV